MLWRCRTRTFDLSHRSLLMGILNVTPDSFSDGGRYLEPGAAIARGLELLGEGADLIDLGAESTRPGSRPVPAAEQWRRLEPVVAGLRRAAPGACLSVDTASAEVAERALAAGVEVVNDVTALGDPSMAAVVAAAGAGVVLMHMQGNPATMQRDPRYGDVVAEVAAWLEGRRAAAVAAGIADERIVLDPGVGFGKTVAHSLALLARLDALSGGRPVLVGVSRKSFLGRVLADPERAVGPEGGRVEPLPPDQRFEGGLAATGIAVLLGARIVRTHDVAATARAVRVADALRAARQAPG